MGVRAIASDRNGLVVKGSPVSWTSADTSVVRLVSISAYLGTATLVGIRPGSTTISATSGLGLAVVNVTVHGPGPVATVSILSESELSLGRTLQLNVVQRDSDNVVVAAPLPTFSSSDSTIARVTVTGLVIGVAEGTATITATSAGRSGSKRLTVIASEHAFMWSVASGMIDLGTLPGFVSSHARAVSAAGHVAGTLSSIRDSLTHAFIRAPGPTALMRDLGGLPDGGSSEAFGVNSAGHAVGYAVNASGRKRAVLWRSTGEVVELGAVDGTQESAALGINDAGQVVGWVRALSVPHPFIWTERDGMRMLGGASGGVAYAINRSGAVAGVSDERPVVWNSASSLSMLRTLSLDKSGEARAIGNAGDIVGASVGCEATYYYDDGCNLVAHPVMWTGASAPADLRKVSGSAPTIVQVLGINDARQVVGSATNRHAILWSADGLRDLGVLPGRMWSSATAINDAGLVVGSSSNH